VDLALILGQEINLDFSSETGKSSFLFDLQFHDLYLFSNGWVCKRMPIFRHFCSQTPFRAAAVKKEDG
jgi:hypothetical protein